MYINLVFISYMVALFLGFSNIVIAFVSLSNKSIEKTTNYKFYLGFICVCFSYILLYFIFYYRESTLNVYTLEVGWRLLDFAVCPAIILIWMCFIRSLSGEKNQKSKIAMVAVVVTGIRIAVGFFVTIAHMDGYYFIADKNFAGAFFIVELLLILTTVTIVVVVYYQTVKHLPLSRVRIFVSITTLAICLLEVLPAPVNYNLYMGHYELSAWNFETFDITSFLFIIINMANLIFLIKEDFSPVYIAETVNRPERATNMKDTSHVESAPSATSTGAGVVPTTTVTGGGAVPTITVLLDKVAETHRLTVREREVIEYAYKGLSNPDIAVELYVSRNTIKRHLHNIFEKLDVSSRMELIHLINSQKID